MLICLCLLIVSDLRVDTPCCSLLLDHAPLGAFRAHPFSVFSRCYIRTMGKMTHLPIAESKRRAAAHSASSERPAARPRITAGMLTAAKVSTGTSSLLVSPYSRSLGKIPQCKLSFASTPVMHHASESTSRAEQVSISFKCCAMRCLPSYSG
jgi:hypothetical protein